MRIIKLRSSTSDQGEGLGSADYGGASQSPVDLGSIRTSSYSREVRRAPGQWRYSQEDRGSQEEEEEDTEVLHVFATSTDQRNWDDEQTEMKWSKRGPREEEEEESEIVEVFATSYDQENWNVDETWLTHHKKVSSGQWAFCNRNSI